jgi:hypothetical protein
MSDATSDWFDRRLAEWVGSVYAQRELQQQERERSATERIYNREKAILIGLSVQLMAAIASIVTGHIWLVLVGLVVMYVGAAVSTAWTLAVVRRYERGMSSSDLRALTRASIAACPTLDDDDRVALTRMINLMSLRITGRTARALRRELDDAMSSPRLRSWPFMAEVDAVVGHESA